MEYKRIPKDVMKLILNYYLSDYSWLAIGLGKHKANDDFICCEQCKSIINCKKSDYHNRQSLIKNLISIPTLKRVCKFYNYYITKWFHKNWNVKSWKQFHHIDRMISVFDKATPQSLVESFFFSLYKIINSDKEMIISYRRRSDDNALLFVFAINITFHDYEISIKYNCSHNDNICHEYLIEQDENADFGWNVFLINTIIKATKCGCNLGVCDIMSLIHLPNFNNMIDPIKMKQIKIRYH